MPEPIKRYLYNCYCGPTRLREDQKTKHPGYVYENCPRVAAPRMHAPKISEIKDIRMQKFYNNFDKYIDILRKNGVTRADLVGSFVRGQQSHLSDIDIQVFGVREDQQAIDEISKSLLEIDNLNFDIVLASVIHRMPHMSLERGDVIVLFSDNDGYIYDEARGSVWTF